MCVNWEQAKALRALSATSRGNLYIRHNRRFEPGFQHVREIIDSGLLGEVFEIKLRRVGYSRRDDWQTIMEFGGGQLLNWGPHIVDHSLRLLGAPLKSLWSDLKQTARRRRRGRPPEAGLHRGKRPGGGHGDQRRRRHRGARVPGLGARVAP